MTGCKCTKIGCKNDEHLEGKPCREDAQPIAGDIWGKLCTRCMPPTEAIVRLAVGEPESDLQRIEVLVPGGEIAMKLAMTLSKGMEAADFMVLLLSAFNIRAKISRSTK